MDQVHAEVGSPLLKKTTPTSPRSDRIPTAGRSTGQGVALATLNPLIHCRATTGRND